MTKIKTKQKEWWRETFSEAYFSLWNPFSSESQEWTKNELKIIDDLDFKKESNILDIPCGQGRHSVELAKKGFYVTGVDYSAVSLRTAEKLAANNKVSPIFLKQDMRHLKLKDKFDAVLMLGNSFGYFSDEENEAIIKKISGLLKQNGFFVIHLLNPIKALKQFGKKETIKISNGHIDLKDTSFNPITFIRKSKWVIIQDGDKKILNINLRFYAFPEIKSMFSRYKLNIIKTYGSFDKKPYKFDSPLMIVIAEKKDK